MIRTIGRHHGCHIRHFKSSMTSCSLFPKQSLIPKYQSKKLLYFVLVVGTNAVCMLLWWRSAIVWSQQLVTLQAGSMFGNWSTFEDSHSLDGQVDPATIKDPNLSCLGWRKTSSCYMIGSSEPREKECNEIVIGGSVSGYCVMKDKETGLEVRVMQVDCTSLRKGVKFSCSQAKQIAKMPAQIDRAVAKATWKHQTKQSKTRSTLRLGEYDGETPISQGIVMVGYPKLLVGIHATIRILRTVHNCSLPIELWFLKNEMTPNGEDPMETQPILRSLVNDYGPVTLHMITDTRVKGFNTKIDAITHSNFDQLLFLDADNIPVRDPTYLFNSPAFNSTGAVFWPDFWHPRDTIFNIKERSLLWEVLGLPFIDMFEQESAQLLIDRRRAQASGAFAALRFLAFHTPNLVTTLKLVHGDKDLFRLAWMKASAPFHMVAHLPGAAGSIVTLEDKSTIFCGMTMVQFDPDVGVDAGPEGILFMHRNAKKLTGEEDKKNDTAWTHLQIFQYPEEAMRTPQTQYEHAQLHYRVRAGVVNEATSSVGSDTCFGDREFKSPFFSATEIVDTTPWRIHELETVLLQFGRDAIAFHKSKHKR